MNEYLILVIFNDQGITVSYVLYFVYNSMVGRLKVTEKG